MCESGERAESIQTLISEFCAGKLKKIKFEMTSDKKNDSAGNPNPVKTNGQNKYDIVNDSAVKTVLIGLVATITGIEETNKS